MIEAGSEGVVFSEAERVIAWREARLLAGGFGFDDARGLAAELKVDLHEALALVAAGCPPRLAADILL